MASSSTALDALELGSIFELSIRFWGNTTEIIQLLVVQLHARVLATDKRTNVYDKKITDTYTFGVNARGQLECPASEPKIFDSAANVQTNSFENFFTQFNDLTTDIEKYAKNYASQSQWSIPADTVCDYIFPRGQTFLFKQGGFSDYQDLTALITYTRSTPVFTLPVPPLSKQ
jgi:hypothetical protein